MSEVRADKAYASLANFEEAADCGGQACIAFKETASGAIGGEFEKAFHYFKFEQEKYMAHYHKRSNVESTFSAVRRKFGDAVMGKTDTAMTNRPNLVPDVTNNAVVALHLPEFTTSVALLQR